MCHCFNDKKWLYLNIAQALRVHDQFWTAIMTRKKATAERKKMYANTHHLPCASQPIAFLMLAEFNPKNAKYVRLSKPTTQWKVVVVVVVVPRPAFTLLYENAVWIVANYKRSYCYCCTPQYYMQTNHNNELQIRDHFGDFRSIAQIHQDHVFLHANVQYNNKLTWLQKPTFYFS